MGLGVAANEKVETLAVVGLGYIGLPTAALFSQHVRVIGVDTNAARLEEIAKGNFNSGEPGLMHTVHEAIKSGSFSVSSEMPDADAYIIAVPTPIGPDKLAILDYVYNAVDAISPKLKGGELIIIESTCPPKTTDAVVRRLADARPDLRPGYTELGSETSIGVHVAYCPERILPGSALEELKANNRIVGGYTPESAELASELYKLICDGNIRTTDAATAELAKLVENAFRDVNLAFANEVSMVSDELGVDVWELIALANQHPRVNILNPGAGVGGHCIAVDPWFIVGSASHTNLIETARNVNDSKPLWVVEKLQERIDAKSYERVALLGLSFKADIDDLRESPALLVANELTERYPTVDFLVVEPHVNSQDLFELRNVRQTSLSDALNSAELIAILVDHSAFKTVDWASLGAEVLDFRGIR